MANVNTHITMVTFPVFSRLY